MALDKSAARALIGDQLWPALKQEKHKLDRIDRWYRWEHDAPHKPSQATTEYKQLVDRSQTPWLGLVVTTVAQALYVEGYRSSGASEDAPAWSIWQANGMDARQIAVHRAALAYGLAYTVVTPGVDFTGQSMPQIRGLSPRRCIAFYADPAADDWPTYALRAEPAVINGGRGQILRLYDDELVWRFHVDESERPEYVTYEEHETGVCPVIRYANQLDLEGRTPGEVEPFIPIAGRIDQTTFDRLVVQRFSSWVVRTIAGMSRPEGMSQEEYERKRLTLKVEDLLVADDPDTKFGSLPATPMAGFVEAKDADIRDLAAVSQTPPHHLLGQMANLSAEALAAAEAATNRKVEERKHSFGESHEQTLRCASLVAGDIEGARDVAAQVRWRDMESRSLAQVADALGKLAQSLKVPVEMLWEKVPGFTDQDVERARGLYQSDDPLTAMLAELQSGQTSQT